MELSKKRIIKELCNSYYTRCIDDGRTILDVWEKGQEYGDSITPSVHCESYRAHILSIVESNFVPGTKILSIGAGNGFTECLLNNNGYDILCFDPSPRAVELCRNKGLNALSSDFFSINPDSVKNYDVVYMDGVLGHIVNEELSIEGIANKLEDFLDNRKSLIISNDLIPGVKSIKKHKFVDDYYFVSDEFVCMLLSMIGFSSIYKHSYNYNRPISGTRTRRIFLADFN